MPRIELKDFMCHTSLSALKCSATGENAAFITSICDEAANGYRLELWLYHMQSLCKADIPSGFSFFEWEAEHTLLIGWRTERTTQLRRLNVVDHSLLEGEELPFLAKSVLPLADGRYAVTTQWDKNRDDEGIHREFEIFEELPLRQNAVGYTSGIRCELSLYDPKTGALEPVSVAPFDVEKVCLTPDGGSLVYSGRAYSGMRLLDYAIWRYRLADGYRQEVLSQSAKMFLGYFDRDNTGVTYSATDRSAYGFSQIKHIYRFEFDTEVTRMLTRCERNVGVSEVISDSRRGELSAFCLHGGELFVNATWGYETHVQKLAADQTFREVFHLEGGVDALALTAGGTLLVIAQQGQRLQELYRVENGTAVRLSAFNEDFYQRVQPAKPQHFVFENDGTQLDGWILYPEGYDAAKKYPAILDIHGGPRLTYGEVYMHEMQAWSGLGYFVLFCNPRGSGGRGDLFSDLWNPKKLGTWDYGDVMALVDAALLRCPAIEKNRIGVTGGSYGGFLTNWIIGQTGRFAVAASQRSISNWFSNALTSDNGYYDWDRMADTDIWTDIEQLWRISPIHYAKNATTPTLFLQTFEDFRCPFGEGLQMFTCLKMNGVPARMCSFYQENHDMSRMGKPKNRLKRLKELVNWFDGYLSPGGTE